MYSLQIFQRTLGGLGITADCREMFESLDSAYRDGSRHYHTHQHIADCLSLFESHRALAQKPAEVEVAIWFHDVVYDVRRADNEEKSARWCADDLNRLPIASAVVGRIADLILSTASHEADSGDAALLVDIDLAILGAPAADFEAYDLAIRKEYNWVPLEDYRRGRAEVLQGFLDRPAIYYTEDFQVALEDAAHRNLRLKIRELTS